MKRQLKYLLERTPVLDTMYEAVRRKKTRNGYWRWTAEDEQRRKFYGQFIHPGDTVFDVGANLGNRTKVFLRLGAGVVAFEPQKQCSEYLETVLGGTGNFRLVRKALGDAPGRGEMLVSNAHVLSTLSQEWPEVTKESGRFSRYEWNERQTVEIITMDGAIGEFGVPSFVKIDVEGFEYHVLSGLSRPVPAMSIEFAAEQIENTYRCIDHMSAMGPAAFQVSSGESMKFDLPTWIPADEMKDALADLVKRDALAWGDVYIRSAGA